MWSGAARAASIGAFAPESPVGTTRTMSIPAAQDPPATPAGSVLNSHRIGLTDMTPRSRAPALILLASLVAGCADKGDDSADAPVAATPVPAETPTPTPGSTGNLFRFDYEIIGTPVVGSPVSIDLAITSASGNETVDLAFRIPDPTALVMDAAQPSDLRRTPSSGDPVIRERVTVIPQREGRLFINVSASRSGETGSLTSSIAIPIHVGNIDTSIREQGETRTSDDGEPTRALTSE